MTMINPTTARLGVLVALALIALGHLVRIGLRASRDRRALVLRILGSVFLTALHPLLSRFRPTPLPLELIGVLAQYYAAYLAYLITLQLLEERSSPRLWPRHLFWIVSALGGLVLLGMYVGRDNLASFSDTEPYRPTVLYYATELLNYSLLLALCSLILQLYRQSLRRYRGLTFVIWRVVIMAGFAVLWVGLLAMVINLLGSATIGDRFRAELNAVYQISKPLFGLLLLIGLLPQRLLNLLAWPLRRWLTSKREQQQALLEYLHSQMVRIAPSVSLAIEQLRPVRVEIEISDARELIWSQRLRTAPLTPTEEARELWELLGQRVQIESPGPYEPPPRAVRNLRKHNLAVARQLKRWEAGDDG